MDAAIALLVRPPNLRHLVFHGGSYRIPTPIQNGGYSKASQLKTLDVSWDWIGTLDCLLEAKRSNNCYALDFSQIRKISLDIDARLLHPSIETTFNLFSKLLCLEELKIIAYRAFSLTMLQSQMPDIE